MNRRGFFGALVGEIAAAAGLRGLVARPAGRAGRWSTSRSVATMPADTAGVAVQANRVVLLKTASMGKSELAAHMIDDAFALPGTAPWRAPVEARVAPLDAPVPARALGRDLPEVWPGFTTPIGDTAALPPLAQLERLMEMFGQSGDAAPAFAAALIGELVLTRLRLADLRRIHAPAGLPS